MSATPPETSLPYDRTLGVDALLRRSGWSAAGTLARSRIDSFRCLPVVAGRLDPFARQETERCMGAKIAAFLHSLCLRCLLAHAARSVIGCDRASQNNKGAADGLTLSLIH